MYATDVLGSTISGFVCSSTGVCSGTERSTQQAFLALQTQINRVGARYGTKIGVDGKIGPATVSALTRIALNLSKDLGTNLDRALEDLLIETGTPTTARDVAGNAEALTAALERDGVAARPWSVITSIKDAAAQIVAAGAAAGSGVPTTTAQSPIPPNPYENTTPMSPQAPPAAGWVPPQTPPATSAFPGFYPAPARAGVPGWALAVGGTVLAVGGGIIAALLARR